MNPVNLHALIPLVVAGSVLGCATFQEVTIRTVPAGGQISVNGVPYGPAPVKARLMADAAGGVGPYEVVASHPGYKEKKVTLKTDSFYFSNPRPYPDPVVITFDGPPPQTSAPVRIPREPAPVRHETPQPPKRESWR
jgi:hypothetical protein